MYKILAQKSKPSTTSITKIDQIKKLFERMIPYLDSFSKETDIIFPTRTPPSQDFHDSLKKIGWEQTQQVHYRSASKDPAGALRKLYKHRPLYLECNTALRMAINLAFIDIFGAQRFNDYIFDTNINKELYISPESQWTPLKYRVDDYSLSDFLKVQHRIPRGYPVYVFGITNHSTLFDLGSDSGNNGLFDHNQNNAPGIHTFDSPKDKTFLTLTEIYQHYETEQSRPMSYHDFFCLMEKKQSQFTRDTHRQLSPQHIWDSLAQANTKIWDDTCRQTLYLRKAYDTDSQIPGSPAHKKYFQTCPLKVPPELLPIDRRIRLYTPVGIHSSNPIKKQM